MYNLHLHIWTNIWQNRLINIRQIIISKATFPPNSSAVETTQVNRILIEFWLPFPRDILADPRAIQQGSRARIRDTA